LTPDLWLGGRRRAASYARLLSLLFAGFLQAAAPLAYSLISKSSRLSPQRRPKRYRVFAAFFWMARGVARGCAAQAVRFSFCPACTVFETMAAFSLASPGGRVLYAMPLWQVTTELFASHADTREIESGGGAAP
jgi:hypothetical protein